MRAAMLSYIKRKTSELKQLFLWLLNKPEWLYFVLALPVVMIFVFITPPFQGPDEEAHYIRVQYIANGQFVPAGSSHGIPSSIQDVTKTVFYEDDIRGRTTAHYELSRTKEALGIKLNPQETYTPAMVSYSPLAYLPAIPGVVISNWLNLSPLISMYVARISLALASIAVFFFAIRLLPGKKYLLVAIGLIPMVLFQQAVVTADSLSYALLALFLSYTLYLRTMSSIRAKQWVIIGLIALAITLAKPLVFIFLPLILILVNKPKSLRYILLIGAVCAAILAGWMLLSGAKSETVPSVGIPENVDSTAQANLLKDNPRRGLRVMWNSYMTPYGDDEVRGILGIFGAADTVYPLWMFTLYAGILLFLFATTFDKTSKRDKIKWPWKLMALILSALYFILVNFVIYLGYSPVNFDIFYGVQGRYFIPILIVLATFVFTGGVLISRRDELRVKVWISLSITALLLLALLITYQRYYLYTP